MSLDFEWQAGFGGIKFWCVFPSFVEAVRRDCAILEHELMMGLVNSPIPSLCNEIM